MWGAPLLSADSILQRDEPRNIVQREGDRLEPSPVTAGFSNSSVSSIKQGHYKGPMNISVHLFNIFCIPATRHALF